MLKRLAFGVMLASLLTALPLAAQTTSPLSDWLRVWDPAGNLVGEATVTEAEEVANGPDFIYIIPDIPVDETQFGNYTTLWEGNPTNFSDVFGIAFGVPGCLHPDQLCLAFSSDVEGIPGGFTGVGPGPAGHFEELDVVYDATFYLHPALQAEGFRAGFFSDVPEPGSLLLLGIGLFGLFGVGRVTKRKSAS